MYGSRVPPFPSWLVVLVGGRWTGTFCLKTETLSLMKAHQPLILAIHLICGSVYAEDACEFSAVEIPRNERRLMELARVVEFRCEAALPQALVDDEAHGNCQFIAERYQDGKCVGRQWFSASKHSIGEITEGSYESIISFGWHMDEQKLVGVHDTGYFHRSGVVMLPEFSKGRPHLSQFFRNSEAEPRISESGIRLNLYPIIALRGSKPRALNDGTVIEGRTGTAVLSTNSFKSYPDAVIVYLYVGTGQPTPVLEVSPQGQEALADIPQEQLHVIRSAMRSVVNNQEWNSDKAIEAEQETTADQPATASELKLEGKEIVEPEPKGRLQ